MRIRSLLIAITYEYNAVSSYSLVSSPYSDLMEQSTLLISTEDALFSNTPNMSTDKKSFVDTALDRPSRELVEYIIMFSQVQCTLDLCNFARCCTLRLQTQ